MILIIGLSVLFLTSARSGFSQILPDTCAPSTWSVNNSVWAICPHGDIVYIGGEFTKVGRYTWNWGVFDNTTGALENYCEDELGREPTTVCQDGKGGWYAGNGLITHVTSNGVIDTAWKSEAYSYCIYVLAANGTKIFAAGERFISAPAGRQFGSIVAIDAATGKVDTSWAAKINGKVFSLIIKGSILYAGGSFDSVEGKKQYNIAAFDAATGKALPWNPAPNPAGYVYAVASEGGMVYAGGVFITIGGQGGPFFAALDSATGNALPFDAKADGSVKAIAIKGSSLFVGGEFTKIGNRNRNHIACLDAATGNATSWDPNADSMVSSIAIKGAAVFAVGKFKYMGGQARNSIAALTAETGNVLSWNPMLDSTVNAISIDGSRIFIGGKFNFIDVKYQRNIAAISLKTGKALSWNSSIKGGKVRAILADGNTVYVGGEFDTAGGQVRKGVAAFDAVTGAVTAFNPALACSSGRKPLVASLLLNGATLYIGGQFDTVYGQKRTGFAAINTISNTVSEWNMELSGRAAVVFALALEKNKLYIGGVFDTTQGFARNGLAALDASTGKISSWCPRLRWSENINSAFIYSIIPYRDAVFAGGAFDSADNLKRKNIVCLDSSSGNATPWNSLAISPSHVHAMALADTILVFSGYYDASLNFLSALSGNQVRWWNVSLWDGELNSAVYALATSGNALYAGGSFKRIRLNMGSTVTVQVRSCFARYGEHSAFVAGKPAGNPPPSPRGISLNGNKIAFSLAKPEQVRLAVFNMSGKRIFFTQGVHSAGCRSLDIGITFLPSGVYILKLDVGPTRLTRRISVVNQ